MNTLTKLENSCSEDKYICKGLTLKSNEYMHKTGNISRISFQKSRYGLDLGATRNLCPAEPGYTLPLQTV